jgi:transcription-repair coupling factor (superfamily II helicase)
MRDLEIRGAGNLLGTGQTGHIAAIGYDLYCQMVNAAIAELNGEDVRPPAEIKIELPLDAHLPADYVAREDVRLDAYRRLAEVRSQRDVDDIATEWADRFGPVPPAAATLLEIGRVRAECARTGVTEVTVTRGAGYGAPLTIRMTPLELAQSKQMRLGRLYKGSIYKADVAQVQVPARNEAAIVPTILDVFGQLVPDEASTPPVAT